MVIGLLTVVLLGAIVTLTGSLDLSATTPPGKLEERLADFVLDRSVQKRAPEVKNPRDSSPAVLSEGLSHYRANCLPCHAAPKVEPFEFGKGLNPAPPDLSEPSVQARSDGELFWITRHGIRMTGMPAFGPTHTDDEIWGIVAFVRHLPELQPEEVTILAAAAENQKHHHEEPAQELPEKDDAHAPGTPPHKH